MKNQYILMAVAAGLSLTACSDDFLEVTSPTDTFIEEYYVTEKSIDEALVAAYAPLHWYDYGTKYNYCSLNFIADLLGDDLYPNGGSSEDQPFIQLLFNYSATPQICAAGIWGDSYSGVKRSNDVLKYLGWVKDLSDAKKNEVEIQARLLRVFYYNQLWKFFGNVPCYFENLEAPYICEQSTADEVYAKLIEELEENILPSSALKEDWPEEEKGRVTRPMAYMLYTEMVMIQKDQARYSTAYNYMKDLCKEGSRFKLLDDYSAIWDEENEWCSESIWEINYYDDNSVRGWGNQLAAGGSVAPRLWGPRSFQCTTPTDPMYADVDAGWGFGSVPTHTYQMFDPADKRLKASIIDLEANGTSDDKGWQYTGYHTYKYICKKANNKDQKADADLGFNNNLRVYRLAEALLNAAELALAANEPDKAKTYLNKVRSRAGLPEVEATLDNILDERRHEFVGEGKRYFDLVRTGKAASVLTPANDEGGYRTKAWSEAVRFFPIPQEDIDAAQGTLKQNGNY